MIRHPHNFFGQARRRGPRRAAGFTLIEAALTTTIIGVALVAMLQLIATGTTTNLSGAENTTAMNMAKSIREMTLKMTFAQVLTMDGATYSPPVDSRGAPILGVGNWSQTVDVQPVSPDRLTADIVDSSPQAVRMTVAVAHNGRNVCQVSWYRFRPTP